MKKLVLLGAMTIAMASLAALDKPQKERDKKPDMATCPLHEEHMKAMSTGAPHEGHAFDEMNKRGEDPRGMGFSQTETVHHFLLAKTGGEIHVEVRNAQDVQTIATVRKHLQTIAASFTAGNFAIPAFVHGKDPDGIETMQKLKEKIRYQYEELPSGGRVVIRTGDKKGLQAIHAFLRFQITEHRTGDPLSLR